MFGLLPSLIGAGASLLGGLFGQKSQQDTTKQNIQAQQDFAQHGISWKVADAKAAGINPLTALGASTTSFSNVAGDNSFGQGVSSAGQNIARGMQAMQDPQDRQIALAKSYADLEAQQLDNEVKRAQLVSAHRLVTQPAMGPGLPLNNMTVTSAGIDPTMAGGPFWGIDPQKVHYNPSDPAVSPGIDPDVQLSRTGPNTFSGTPANATVTFDPEGMKQWDWRNRGPGPVIFGKEIAGKKYSFDWWTGNYSPSETGNWYGDRVLDFGRRYHNDYDRQKGFYFEGY